MTRFPAGREGGAVRHQRGESHRRWLIIVMLIMSYDTDSQSRNADFISIAAQSGYPQPSARRAVKLTNPPAAGRFILRTFPGAAAIKNACHILMAGIWICCIISNGQNWDSSDSIWNVPFDFLIDIFALSNGSKYFYGNKKKGSDRDVLQCQSLFWPDRNNT